MQCVLDPYLSRECAFARQGWEYYQTLYNDLAALGQDTPQSRGSVSCELHGGYHIYIIYICLCVYVDGLWVGLCVWGGEQDTPQSRGSVSCELHGAWVKGGVYLFMDGCYVGRKELGRLVSAERASWRVCVCVCVCVCVPTQRICC